MSRVPTDYETVNKDVTHYASAIVIITPKGDGTYRMSPSGPSSGVTVDDTNKLIRVPYYGLLVSYEYRTYQGSSVGANDVLYNEIIAGTSISKSTQYLTVSFPKTISYTGTNVCGVSVNFEYVIREATYYLTFKVKLNGTKYEKIKLNGEIITPKA